MGFKSSAEHYGSIAIAIHWITAIAIASMLVTGTMAANSSDDIAKIGILRIHAIVGALVLALTLFRILWWWLADRKPRPPEGISRAQTLAAKWLHRGLYVLILAMASSGIATLVLSGANQLLFSGQTGPFPDLEGLVPRTVHGLLSRALIVIMAGHIGAALYHQFVRGDHLLSRMGLGR